MADDVLAEGHVALIHYTLRRADGELLEDSRADGEGPYPFLQGGVDLLAALQQRLAGMRVGETRAARIPPEEGYGLRQDTPQHTIDRADLPEGLDLEPGLPLEAEDDEGNDVVLWITEVHDAHIVVDLNHPMAGETLCFRVELVGLRAASAEEQAHGHVHGEDGHDHEG